MAIRIFWVNKVRQYSRWAYNPPAQFLLAGAAVITLSAPIATLTPGDPNLAAGGNVITLSAPVATLNASISLLANGNVITLSAPVATLTPGDPAPLANGNTITLSAPIATISGGGVTSTFWCGHTGMSGMTSGGDIEELD